MHRSALLLVLAICAGALVMASAAPRQPPNDDKEEVPKVVIPPGNVDIALTGEKLAAFKTSIRSMEFDHKELGHILTSDRSDIEVLLLSVGRAKVSVDRHEIKSVKVFVTKEKTPKASLIAELQPKSRDFARLQPYVESLLKESK